MKSNLNAPQIWKKSQNLPQKFKNGVAEQNCGSRNKLTVCTYEIGFLQYNIYCQSKTRKGKISLDHCCLRLVGIETTK